MTGSDSPMSRDNNSDKDKKVFAPFNIRPENIPNELKAIPHWILWGYREKNGKAEKVPIDPKTGALVNAHDSKNWLTFEDALKYSKENNLGLGFDFTKDLGYVFVDLDHVLENGVIKNQSIKTIVELSLIHI